MESRRFGLGKRLEAAVRGAAETSEGSTFSPSRPVEPMASDSVTAGTADTGTDALLHSLVRGKRGEALRAQLTARYPEIWVEEIEEAIQYACKSFLSEAEGISVPGQVYTWIRTAALRYLNREADRRRREIPSDPVAVEKGRVVEDAAGPAEELIELEDDADLELLVGELSGSLSDRQRDVFALYGAGYKRPQIADRLGIRERIVKRDLLEIMDHARTTLGRLAGGGCERGEPLVMRFVFGISGVVRRVADSAGEKLSALKQQVLDGGAQVKQHAATTYYRAVDPTPLAAERGGSSA
jgi:RNA polymerase sigma factor (sigma-70 family)